MTGRTRKPTVSSSHPYLELNNQGEILHFELTQDRHILGRDQTYADLLLPSDWQVISAYHAVIRHIGDSHWIYDGDGREPSTNGLFFNHTRITPTEGFFLQNGVEIKIGQNPNNLVRLRYFNPENSGTTARFPNELISLKNRSLLLGRDPNATLQLDSPIISRRHAPSLLQ